MNKKKLKILIVEDAVTIAANIKNNLTELGYTVTGIAKNSDQAYKLFTAKNPDIAILNVKMKDSKLDGIELAHKMNARQRIPIIYLTSHDDEDTRQRAKTTNPAAYLLKFPSLKQLDLSIEFAINNFYNNIGSSRQNTSFFCPLHKDARYVFIKSKEQYERVDIDDIFYLKSDSSSCYIYTSRKRYMVSYNLKTTLGKLKNNDLIRVHKQNAVNYKKVIAFDSFTAYLECMNQIQEITISRNYGKNIFPLLPKLGDL